MAKSQNDLIYDEALNYIKARCTKITICAGQPTTYAQATTTSGNMLAQTTTVISSTELTVGPGDASGRKITIPAKSGVTIQKSGTGDHVAGVSTSALALLFVTTFASQSLTSGNAANIGAFDFEITDVA